MAEQAHETGPRIREEALGSERDRAAVATADRCRRDREAGLLVRVAQPGVA